MSKSRRYTIPGQTSGSKYVFTFNDKGEVEGVKKQSYIKQISRERAEGVEVLEVASNKGVKIDD